MIHDFTVFDCELRNPLETLMKKVKRNRVSLKALPSFSPGDGFRIRLRHLCLLSQRRHLQRRNHLRNLSNLQPRSTILRKESWSGQTSIFLRDKLVCVASQITKKEFVHRKNPSNSLRKAVLLHRAVDCRPRVLLFSLVVESIQFRQGVIVNLMERGPGLSRYRCSSSLRTSAWESGRSWVKIGGRPVRYNSLLV